MTPRTIILTIVVLLLIAAFAEPIKACLRELNDVRLAKDSLLTLLVAAAVLVLVIRFITGPHTPRPK